MVKNSDFIRMAPIVKTIRQMFQTNHSDCWVGSKFWGQKGEAREAWEWYYLHSWEAQGRLGSWKQSCGDKLGHLQYSKENSQNVLTDHRWGVTGRGESRAKSTFLLSVAEMMMQ